VRKNVKDLRERREVAVIAKEVEVIAKEVEVIDNAPGVAS